MEPGITFDGAGWMVTGWLKRPSGWYYLTGSGAMATGWIQLGSTWYYLNESGTMQADTWIGNNYVDGSGAWIPGKVKAQAGWIQSGSLLVVSSCRRKLYHQWMGSDQPEPGTTLTEPAGW